MNNRKIKIGWLLLTGGLLGLGAHISAQSPGYIPPPPPTKNVKFELRVKYLVAPDIAFKGLGSVPSEYELEGSNNILLGTERFIDYDDGFLRQDYISTTLVAGGLDGSESVPSTNTDATSNFSYSDPNQVVPNDPTALLFHRYSSTGDPDVEFAGASDGAFGWELNYTKYINRKRNLGIQVGFSFNGFDSGFNKSIDADLYIQEFRHNMANGANVPDLPDPVENDDGTFTQNPYTGDIEREDVASGNLLEWIASEETEELIADGAVVDSKADLRSSVYNFRAGPTYNLSLGQSFAFSVGLGVSAIYYSGEFSAYEILQNPAEGINPSRGLTTTDDSEWQVGGYVDASAYFNVSERVSLFSGLQVQSGSSYTQQNEEREVSVDFSSQVYVHAGLGIRF
ncbi:hypothetical protein G0Q06_08050 [Puniceicoccales bacterium CK1056]|uniref:Uncharacterized protein n=1 Tax=Oceanipulchritudo coccoides TaxID=2706888 RepID=A0A6B2M0G3_9BACT|nr:hypothetical protein [Oceanipulchritudo coccoides]NDV62398.1 hypothetical protein [Oceanipulchritudo coccoides]